MDTTLLAVILAVPLGLIPANIAKKKGYSFGLWWLYGWALFIVAIIHVSLIPDKNAQQPAAAVPAVPKSASDEIREYKKLWEDGLISEAEYEEKKKKLLEREN